MKTIKTDTGFKVKIDGDIRDDMELLDALTAVSRGDMTHIPDMVERLVGKDGKAALYEHCRGKNGRVSTKSVVKEVQDILEKIKEADDGGDVKN